MAAKDDSNISLESKQAETNGNDDVKVTQNDKMVGASSEHDRQFSDQISSGEYTPNLFSLPTELQMKILEHFTDDPVTSMCLGVTCKELYVIHKTQFKIVSLFEPTECFWLCDCECSCENPMLYSLLKNWLQRSASYSEACRKRKARPKADWEDQKELEDWRDIPGWEKTYKVTF